ncbi:asparaginase [Chryseomicrobium aureum]|uniref:asparaginase n=1 Tax=Chryseomicrobium aureum TaxID=1441723 RepID=UPI001956D1C3|nr:asparaginase [Chryseomicrobium aureum]MBM7705500.1 L-asparaginase [Chryseomicrobium aureum]
MKKLLLLHTGGTISMHADAESAAVMTSEKNPLSAELDKLAALAEIEELEVFNLPSPHITPQHMLELKSIIEQKLATSHFDGVVITHGTDTLEETAYFLDLTLQTDTPIVLTGAMRSSNELGADGVYNLLTASRVALHKQANAKGVLVVLNDEIHTAEGVTKTHTSNVSTFQSPSYGPIGHVTKKIIHFHHTPLRTPSLPIATLEKRVGLLKVYAGMEPEIIEAIFNTGYDGIVLEGLGQGNIPPALVPEIEKLQHRGIPVVLVSRCFNGIALDVYGYAGGGRDLKNRGVHFAHGLNGQKARLALLAALHQDDVDKALFHFFQSPFEED